MTRKNKREVLGDRENESWLAKAERVTRRAERRIKREKRRKEQEVRVDEDGQEEISRQELTDFIYVPSIEKQVYPERVLTDKSYNEAQEQIPDLTIEGIDRNFSILTPYQFREFLKHLRDSGEREYQELFNEITEVRDPWRANWLNAKFEEKQDGLYMISKNVLVDGEYKTEKQRLDDVLMKDKTPGINLNELLDSDKKHGLPPADISDGDLDYWHPRENNFARFVAYSVRADLDCGHPSDSYSSLGVFVCCEAADSERSK